MHVLNVTKEEYRNFRRARERNELFPGHLGRWALETFGFEAWHAIRNGNCFIRRVRQVKLPTDLVPRLEEVSEQRAKELLLGEKDDEEEEGGTDGDRT